MFNLDTDALTAQISARSSAEKKALVHYVAQYERFLARGDDEALASLLNDMISDPEVSVQTFVAFYLAFNA